MTAGRITASTTRGAPTPRFASSRRLLLGAEASDVLVERAHLVRRQSGAELGPLLQAQRVDLRDERGIRRSCLLGRLLLLLEILELPVVLLLNVVHRLLLGLG